MIPSLFNENDITDHDSLLLETNPSPETLLETQLNEHPDLPLGKAIHLLLHVKPHVLATAIDQVWKQNTPFDQRPSPIAHALTSLDHHLSQHQRHHGNDDSSMDAMVRHIYDPLKSKVLKSPKNSNTNTSSTNSLQLLAALVLWSPHRALYQQCLEREISPLDNNINNNKRGALSVSLLLWFITQQWPSLSNDMTPETVDQVMIIARFIPGLIQILDQVGELPTLLACTTYDTLLTISVYVLDIYLSPTDIESSAMASATKSIPPYSSSSSTNITVIEEKENYMVDEKQLKAAHELWTRLNSLLNLAKKWQQSSDPVTLGAWDELVHFMIQSQAILTGSNLEGYQQVRKGWRWLTNVLLSSQILSKNPIKKWKTIWTLEDKDLDMNLSSYLKMIMFALRQNGYWLQHQQQLLEQKDKNMTISPPSSSAGTDQLDYQEQVKSTCCTMVSENGEKTNMDVAHSMMFSFLYDVD
ncbi:uncharacterized protein BX664DRAFT_83245 [Halteromyces radiatus]|uniref:uncharacterized protein n=1 Tax=Halteromyces radiatus TaxID=101107 RepID=UPI0022205EE7|nr:uncharacterized protein BX664DRAFT_83245 [Halteromyces radiatus]KAI8097610.1 hypothetical protein BX664DRAFT_83245 [Halteromyces radiatus]